jgi:hypothetical protein
MTHDSIKRICERTTGPLVAFSVYAVGGASCSGQIVVYEQFLTHVVEIDLHQISGADDSPSSPCIGSLAFNFFQNCDLTLRVGVLVSAVRWTGVAESIGLSDR